MADPSEGAEVTSVPGEPTRADVIAGVRTGLIGEGVEPFQAEVLASIYATSWEMEKLLAGIDALGGTGAITAMLNPFGKRKRKGEAT